MKKSEIVARIALEAGISKTSATKAFDVAIESIRASLSEGQNVTIVGFGTFKSTSREARLGRNPRTGATVKIKASKTATFSASKSLKAVLSGPPTGGGGPGKKR